MITRFAFFEGQVKNGRTEAFRDAVTQRLVPLWRQFPGASEVRVMFGSDRDPGAPEFPLILAISYPSRTEMALALSSAVRAPRAICQSCLKLHSALAARRPRRPAISSQESRKLQS